MAGCLARILAELMILHREVAALRSANDPQTETVHWSDIERQMARELLAKLERSR